MTRTRSQLAGLAASAAALTVLGSTPAAAAGDSGPKGRVTNGRISFARYDPQQGDLSIWAANPNGSRQERLTHIPSYDSDWSPDGQRIAFDFADQSGEHLATMNPDGSVVRQITFGSVEEEPSWSPDGHRIAFDASPASPDQPDFHTDIWTVAVDGTDAHQVTHGIFGVEPVYSPDGGEIAFGRIAGVDANDQ